MVRVYGHNVLYTYISWERQRLIRVSHCNSWMYLVLRNISKAKENYTGSKHEAEEGPDAVATVLCLREGLRKEEELSDAA